MAAPTIQALGQAIRVLREERGWSQLELAHRAEISFQYLSGIERGYRNPTWGVLARIAVALDVKLSTLVAHAERG